MNTTLDPSLAIYTEYANEVSAKRDPHAASPLRWSSADVED